MVSVDRSIPFAVVFDLNYNSHEHFYIFRLINAINELTFVIYCVQLKKSVLFNIAFDR